MIDINRYEGHTKGDAITPDSWRIVGDNFVMNGESPSFRYIAYVRHDDEMVIEPFSDADANLIADTPLLLAEVEQLYEEKEAMLKHITDLEEALTELNNDWLAGNDMDEAFTEHFKKFSYLRAQSKAVHDTQQDDGAEPPEHMTADDFNEMHSGPYQPDDTGYMDGDY